jgi:trypsin
MCAGAEGEDSCNGDSGGPLFVRDRRGPVVIGVVSYGSFVGGCGDETYPGVYMEVAAFKSFIDAYR